LSNQQSEIPLKVRPLLRRLKKALELLPRALPPGLKEISFVLVDRKIMARVHGDFLGEPTETDVITFAHGEILICPAVAQERAGEFDQETDNEVLLYGLHGLLHLAGYNDKDPDESKKMAQAQEKLLHKTLAKS
jgi:probable rRNA maturation factor